jgi:hypothetical protein
MKKILAVCLVLVLLITYITPVNANTRNQNQIRNILGVDYTIQPREYVFDCCCGDIKWQFLELQRTLNLRNFPAFTEYGLPNFFNSKMGDAFIVTWPHGLQTIMIDLGAGQLHQTWIENPIILNPQESVDINSEAWRLEQSRTRVNRVLGRNDYTEEFTESDVLLWNKLVAYMRSLDEPEQYTLPSYDGIGGYAGWRMQSDHPEIVRMAQQITRNHRTEFAKAQAIYNWVTGNIVYDNALGDAWMERTAKGGVGELYRYVSSPVALERRTTICGGMMNLTIDLLRAAGIPARMINGWAFDESGVYHFHLAWGADAEHSGTRIYRYIAGMPSIQYMWAEAFVDGRWIYIDSNFRLFNISIEDISKTHIIIPTSFESMYDFTRNQSTVDYQRWVRINFGDPNAFFPDDMLVGTWDRLATVQSLSTFTQSNQRNTNNWSQDILRRRGNSRQQLTFNDNGRITATGITGFGSRWTDGSIGGRGYEIRTIGGNDFLFVNNQSLGSPSAGMGAPWTVFIRR